MSFASQWLPYLKACGFDTKWATEFPWASQILSHEMKLPKRFLVTPADAPCIPPTTDPFPGTEEPDICETRSENSGSKGKGRCNKCSDNKDMDFDEQERSSDDESKGYDDEDYNEEGDTGGKGWCPGPVHHKYIIRKWTKYQANTHPAHPKFIQNFPSQFSCNFPSTGNGQYIHSVPGHVTGISPLGKSWECSKISQRM